MVQAILYTFVSVIIVSLVSMIGIITLSLKEKTLHKILLTLVSLSAGTLIGGALLHLLPEAVEEQGFTLTVSLLFILGLLTFFLIEKFIHLHDTCKIDTTNKKSNEHTHSGPHLLMHESHKKHIGFMNLVGDGLHNFGDGLIIAAAYLTNIPAGIAATIAVILHEVPQEIADFGVLVYSGFSKKKAVLLNLASAGVSILGAIVGLVLSNLTDLFNQFILPFAAGGFIYIAGTNLFPELHKECNIKESVIHFLAIGVGIAIMIGLLFLE